MWYLTSTPPWMRALFANGLTWQGNAARSEVYLTFDDGPHPEVTPWVLDTLSQYKACGTFFCIGENVARYPEVFFRLQREGHAIGNHTQHHLNGWQTDTDRYMDNIRLAGEHIPPRLFRPPYGKITRKQVRAIRAEWPLMNIIMWSGLSADFDTRKTGKWCAAQAVRHCRPGAILVFHDSAKAFPRLREALPATLEAIRLKGLNTALL